MNNDKSINLMLVVFCIVLVGFVLLNGKISKTLSQRQAELEQARQTAH